MGELMKWESLVSSFPFHFHFLWAAVKSEHPGIKLPTWEFFRKPQPFQETKRFRFPCLFAPTVSLLFLYCLGVLRCFSFLHRLDSREKLVRLVNSCGRMACLCLLNGANGGVVDRVACFLGWLGGWLVYCKLWFVIKGIVILFFIIFYCYYHCEFVLSCQLKQGSQHTLIHTCSLLCHRMPQTVYTSFYLT